MASTNPNKRVASSEPLDVIPMKKSSPLVIVAIIAGIAVLIGVVVFSMRSSAEKAANKNAEQATQAQAAGDSTANMTPEEQKRHLEITQKSLALWKEQQAAEEAKKKATEEAAKPKEAAPATPGVAPVAKAGTAAPAAEDEPPPPPKKKASKKDMDQLEGLGTDITGQLNK